MKKNPIVSPVLKWVGGKRQLLDVILPLIPEEYSTYYEPFLGGGAVLFELQPKKAVINDLNKELVNVYQVIQTNPGELLEQLKRHQQNSCQEYYYKVRELDRSQECYGGLRPEERAARIIYLNKTCFNGLFRVNKMGQFNVPWGRYENPNIVNEDAVWAIHKYLKRKTVRICCGDYRDALKNIRKGSFVYFDPPYVPISQSSSFTRYTAGGFGEEEQMELKRQCDKLSSRGVKFLLSNSASPFIEELYRDYIIERVPAKRVINVDPTKRGSVDEILVRNYN